MIFIIIFVVVALGVCFIVTKMTDDYVAILSFIIVSGIFLSAIFIADEFGAFDLDTIPYSEVYAIDKISNDGRHLLSSGDTVSVLVKDVNFIKEIKVPSKVIKYIDGENPSIQIKGLQIIHPSESEENWFFKGYGGLPDSVDKSTVIDDIIYEEVIIIYPQK